MAGNKLRKFISGRLKWILVFLGVMILYVLGLVATIIFVNDIATKVIMIVYEVINILFGLLLFVLSIKKNH